MGKAVRAWAAAALAMAAVVGGGQADARAPRRHHRHATPADIAPDMVESPLDATGLNPAPGIGVGTGIAFGLTPGALVAGATASSYNNAFYGYGTYYAPKLEEAPAQPGYGYFGY